MMYLTYFMLMFIFSIFITDRKQAFMVVLLITFLYLALSFPGGNDWIGYFANYDCVINSKCYADFVMFEPGYQALVYIVGYLGFQPIVIFVAIINIICLYIFANNFENKALIISFLMSIFLWTLYFEAVRQSIAMSVFFVALYSLYCGQVKKYILLILLAASFHITALICLTLVLPYMSIKLSRIFGYGLFLASFIFVSIPTLILENVISLFPVDSMAYLKLNFYLNSDIYKPVLSIGIGTFLDIILICIILLSFSRIKKNQLYTDYTFHHVVFLGIAIYLSFGIFIGKMMPVFTRIGWYGVPVLIILVYSNIGNSIYYKKFGNNKSLSLGGLLLSFYFILQILRPLSYELSQYNIMHQETLLSNIDKLDDATLRTEARKKCLEITRLGHGDLCD